MLDLYIAIILVIASIIGLSYYYFLKNDKKINFSQIKNFLIQIYNFLKKYISQFFDFCKKSFRDIVSYLKGKLAKKKLGHNLSQIESEIKREPIKISKTIKSEIARSKDYLNFAANFLKKIYRNIGSISKNIFTSFKNYLSKMKMPKISFSFLKRKKQENSEFLKKLLDFKEEKVNGKKEKGKTIESIKRQEELSEKSFEEVEKKWVDALIKNPQDVIAYKKLAKLYFFHKDYDYCQEILNTLIKLGTKDTFIDEYQSKIKLELSRVASEEATKAQEQK